MTRAFRGDRLHIAILGRCNTGKSTVLNHITGQQAAIVSPRPGTTGDPVPLSFELLPLGPVTFYDTAGLDENSELGVLRRSAGRKVLARADIILIIIDERGFSPWEEDLIAAARSLETPFLVVGNKQDMHGETAQQAAAWCEDNAVPFLALAADRDKDPSRLREALISLAPKGDKNPLVTDILPAKSTVICVAPIDASAPAGRLIVPQVQVLRELIEANHPTMVVQPSELERALTLLREAPALVITDSQAVLEVAGKLPPDISLTTFSVVFARQKGDFSLLLHGASSIDTLPSNAPVLIAEACSHHAQDDDIARIKIPALLQKHLGRPLDFSFVSGGDFPDDINRFSLVIHCGGCMLNPGEMRRRLKLCNTANVPATNFGMTISATQGLLERIAVPLLHETTALKQTT